MKTQRSLSIVIFWWVVATYIPLVASIRQGVWWGAPIMVLLASPVMMAVMAVGVERRTLAQLFDLSKGSWAFLIGDTFVLTTAAAFCAVAWRSLPRTGWYASWWWPVVSLLIGVAAGRIFHFFDGKRYKAAGATDLLPSPTKGGHDKGVYTILFGGLVFGGVPLLANWTNLTWGVLGCVGVWIFLGVCDGIRKLNHFDLHPKWDKERFRIKE